MDLDYLVSVKNIATMKDELLNVHFCNTRKIMKKGINSSITKTATGISTARRFFARCMSENPQQL